MTSVKSNTKLDFGQFVNLPIRTFRYLGIYFQREAPKIVKYITSYIYFGLTIVLLLQIDFVIHIQDMRIRLESILYINYYLVSIGKVFSIFYNRRAIIENLKDLEECYPKAYVMRRHGFVRYLRYYKRIEGFLNFMCHFISVIYNFQPITYSVYEWLLFGTFTYRTSVPIRFILPVEDYPVEYFICYGMIALSSYYCALIILSCDLYLFSSVIQLSMNLQLLALNIRELEPEKPESLSLLNDIVARHLQIKKIKHAINRIFIPSIIFSLLSSSYIICTVTIKLVDDIPLTSIMKSLLLLVYELKQVVITCFIGNMLIQSSETIFDALYMHDWTKGSLVYRKQVLFMMTNTLRPLVLSVGGIADVSLNTLRLVLSMSYKMFAVLKTTQVHNS